MASSTIIDPQPDTGGGLGSTTRLGTLSLGVYVNPGGVAITASQCKLGVLHDLDVRPAGGYVPAWDKAAGVVRAYQQSAATGALTEVPNTTDLSAVNFRFRAFGTS
jgi:hypothetical protein